MCKARELIVSVLLALFVLPLFSAGTYNPQSGRFLQRDPLGTGPMIVHTYNGPHMISGGPLVRGPNAASRLRQYLDGMNLYEYVRSNPIMLTDPVGGCASEVDPADYPEIDLTKDEGKYNCAGLAFRTYEFLGDINQVKGRLSGAGRTISCSDKCNSCEEKCWLWEYDIDMYANWSLTAKSSSVSRSHIHGPSRDFHIVCGESGKDGSDPTNVCSKNGPRPIERDPSTGVPTPRPGGDWRPPSSENIPYGKRDPKSGAFVHSLDKVRSNFGESCYCIDYKKAGPPKKKGP